MTTSRPRASLASSREVESVADEMLRKGNAVDAAVAGVFAACALGPDVLLGPIQILIGGSGAGFHALDGRVRQPGIGAPRPRGFLDDSEVPDAARVGTPWLPATLAVALAFAGKMSLTHVVGPAVALAKATGREETLRRIAARGARAIEEKPLGAELLALCGRAAGGLLTSDDLASPRPKVVAARRVALGDAGAGASLPWVNMDDDEPQGAAGGVARAVLTVDRYGVFVVACWAEGMPSLPIGDLGVQAPFFAIPVRRGKPRVRPGDTRPAAAPITLVGEAGQEVALSASGADDAYDLVCRAAEAIAQGSISLPSGQSRLLALSSSGPRS